MEEIKTPNQDEFDYIFGNPLRFKDMVFCEAESKDLMATALVFIAYQLAKLNDLGIDTWPNN